jgi:FixJ family two-component response regulator
MSGDAEKCFQAGMDDHVTKPLRYRALFETLKRWVPALADVVAQPADEGPVPARSDTSAPREPLLHS